MLKEDTIKFLCFSAKQGGAAIAAKRIYNALKSQSFSVEMYTADQLTGLAKFWFFFLRLISYALGRSFNLGYKQKISLNLFNSPTANSILRLKGQKINLHWINNDTISIRSLKHLSENNKCVFTLHDEWLYCGNEHYAESRFDITDAGFLSSPSISIPFSSIHTYKRKFKYLKNANFEITVPSTWMKLRVEQSALLGGKRVHVIGNPIPTNIFSPDNPNSLTRRQLGVSDDDFLVLFGAVGGAVNPVKGADLLIRALALLDEMLPPIKKNKVKLVAFGGEFDDSNLPTFNVIRVGHVKSHEEMANLYRLADLTVVPSRAEAFGQVAAESCACGTPVVAFNYSGLKDIIIDNYNGFLAEPFCSKSLAECIAKYISLEKSKVDLMSKNSAEYIKEKFNPAKIASDYNGIYEKLI